MSVPYLMGVYLGKFFISYYGLMIVIGVIVGFVLSIPLIKKFKINIDDYLILVSLVALSCIIGSKILYIMINLKETFLILNFYKLEGIKILTSSGFVFYGGLILSLFTITILRKIKSLNVDQILSINFPIFVIVHGFGRIGCGIVGCCYGVEHNGLLSIVYKNSIIAPNNISLFPTQFVEAFFQISIGILFYIIILKFGIKQIYIVFYLIMYSVFRFIMEYYRGDDMRGFIGKISVSQVISIIIFLFSIVLFILIKKHR